MSQSIVVSVGQAGNQIGTRFWDKVLLEHAKTNTRAIYDDALSSFFRNVDSRRGRQCIPLGDGTGQITGLRARAVLVDMEEGVINQTMRTPLGELFDDHQRITSVSGCGNNWAVGYAQYGPAYHTQLLESFRKEAEFCDSLQSFFLINSLGGGTGSGLGSYIMELLHDEFPEAYRFSCVVCPSADDDVVISPYNSVLSLAKHMEHSDCILPIENQALFDICERIQTRPEAITRKSNSAISDAGSAKVFGGLVSSSDKKPKPWEGMNNVVANLLLNMTSSMRFEGSLNVDINDIVTNLVPFPQQKLLVSSMTPLYSLSDIKVPPRRLDQMFIDGFSRESQLIKADPKSSTYLACALIVRGDVEISDIRRNIDKMKPTLKFASWNQEGWKTGLCSTPAPGQQYNLLTLANNCCITNTLQEMRSRCLKLYKRKANLHHYTSHIELSQFDSCLSHILDVIRGYNRHNL
ncbi:hypothetical protein SeMB42_g05061 [Synchytrium endobioticum]|uniref:Tubulin/FtsZ GTPase domain-containing protein n=1 Tax=Synchytrium endobioticum TaxID=286115 RepID=A0A507CTV1_9FUNG|nr:hypothetical protein SeLEV6574_g06087 [Synchytrium endobioticum]TPX42587.1 hypothetical protein SeMB42_g05063 [Synchytrium endobioticum]TPX42589.1 hypothetical protein SeMB42_g05061 [Synchytrium endobioticum]